ncbi:hypothetical protein Poli38472_001077 [Pythium oligandrum]|uniref:Microsomal glutathione S-transferase 1 n=1 Tax=Pythium oligandrum TaxID=41045 RepID=A0A8K1CUK5_PYTOL|nr:hypothetical protein Poli38472_001077 [Pythium oligandrum]|eukprot:TMW68921.1 hypothetical protein Poli38472_001077 [Pythium oligandrum]
MVLDASDSAVKTLAVCTVLLYLKFVITARLQAVNTFMAGGRPPEDRKLAELTRKDNPGPEQNFAQMGDVPADESLREAIERSERWKRIVANDVESIPLALIVFTMGIFVNSNKTVHIIAIIAFTVLRIMHTYAYANSIQPHRSFIWLGSVLFVLIGGGNVIAGVASN